jgi:hypothetical protein
LLHGAAKRAIQSAEWSPVSTATKTEIGRPTFAGIHQRDAAGDDALLLHALDALPAGGGGQPDLLRDLGSEREASCISRRRISRSIRSGAMPSRRLLLPGLLAACAGAPPGPAPAALSEEAAWIAAEAWHLDLCLPTGALAGGPLAPILRGAPSAAAFAFGFGLEAWMRAARPGSGEALGALTGGPAVVSVRALAGPVPATAEESLRLRLPAGGTAAIAGFVAGQVASPLPSADPQGRLLLIPSRLPYALRFTCNTWVMRALAEAGLPVPVAGIRLRGEAMAALRAEQARQAAGA